jgi:hypothetical protein
VTFVPDRPLTATFLSPPLLTDLVAAIRSLHERVDSLESRCGRGYIPLGQISNRLDRLERAASLQIPDQHERAPETPDTGADLAELMRRLESLERRVSMQSSLSTAAAGFESSGSPRRCRQADGGPLRGEIARILESAPGADGPTVLRALEASQPGRKLPSPRTVRWHLSVLRGSGNGSLPPGPQAVIECAGARPHSGSVP